MTEPKIIYTPSLAELIKNSNIIIDTCVLIEASRYPQIVDLFKKWQSQDCALFSVAPVKYEFLAAAGTEKEYDKLEEFLTRLKIAFLPDVTEKRLAEQGKSFSIAMRRSRVNKPSYVDCLLFSVPFLYDASSENFLVATSNHKDVPREFYDRIDFIVRDNGDEFIEIGIYKFNKTKFNKTIQ